MPVMNHELKQLVEDLLSVSQSLSFVKPRAGLPQVASIHDSSLAVFCMNNLKMIL